MSTSNLLSVKPWKIYTSVSLSGACVMIFELAGARMIGPYFGTSIYVWTNVIGVILASLSLGYYIGGHKADEQDAHRLLASCLGATGLSVLLSLLIHDTVLRNLANLVSDPRFGGLYASLILFALPSIFFGSISPIATRLMLKSLEETGKVTGKIGAISTIGSLIGTFVGGFILIPYLGVQQVMLSVGVLMLVLSAIFSIQHFLKFAGLGTIIIALHCFFPQIAHGERFSTLYNDVLIYETSDELGDSIRIMQVNNHIGSAQYLHSDDLVYPYLRQFRMDQQLVPGFTHTLTIGGAACSYPRELLMKYDDVTVDVIEIDGKLIELAHSHFDLPYSSRLKTYSQDGRYFIQHTDKTYDVVYLDAFNDLRSIPFQLTTQEFFTEIERILDSEGAVLINALSSLAQGKTDMIDALVNTARTAFPYVKLLRVEPDKPKDALQSLCIVAMKKPIELTKEQVEEQEISLSGERLILRDDFAPIERLVQAGG